MAERPGPVGPAPLVGGGLGVKSAALQGVGSGEPTRRAGLLADFLVASLPLGRGQPQELIILDIAAHAGP